MLCGGILVGMGHAPTPPSGRPDSVSLTGPCMFFAGHGCICPGCRLALLDFLDVLSMPQLFLYTPARHMSLVQTPKHTNLRHVTKCIYDGITIPLQGHWADLIGFHRVPSRGPWKPGPSSAAEGPAGSVELECSSGFFSQMIYTRTFQEVSINSLLAVKGVSKNHLLEGPCSKQIWPTFGRLGW